MKTTFILILLIFFQVHYNIYGQNILSKTSNEKITINIYAELMSDSGYDIIHLKDLVNNSSKLIIRYSNINWGMCNAEDLIDVNHIVGKIGKENIILITAPSHPKHLALFKDTNTISIPVYQFIGENLALPLEAENIPFLFVIDENDNAQYLFAPNLGNIKLTNEYLKHVKEKFF